MTDSVEEIFDAMNASEMNDWVGGGDVRAVARQNTNLLGSLVKVETNFKILDFGCGIGRVTAGLLDKFGRDIEIEGTDIVPKMIDFCSETIASQFSNTSFYCLDAQNNLYDGFRSGNDVIESERSYFQSRAGYFDLVCAFSVFTHLNRAEFVNYLEVLRKATKQDGVICFTAFVIDRQSRRMIEDRFVSFKISLQPEENDFHYERLHYDNPLAFVGVPLELLQEMLISAGWATCSITFGSWRGGVSQSASFQDVIVARPMLPIPENLDEDRYLAQHIDVANSRNSARWHYVRYGRDEGRST